jgi:hypothetical protein
LLAFMRGRASLGVAMKDGAQKADMLAQATACARHIRREGTAWGEPIARWLEAGVDAARGDAAGAKRGALEAAKGFDGNDMTLFAWLARLGEAKLGGDAEAIRVAEEPLRARGVVRPERMLALFAPSFA